MSAVNASITPSSLDAERRSHEPSMEEILASIRRIIADDEALPVVRREKEKKEPRIVAEAPRIVEPSTAPAEQAPERAPAVVVPVRPPHSAEARPSASPPAPALQPQDYWLRPTHRPEPEAEAEEAPVDEMGEQAQTAEDVEVDDADESEALAEAYLESTDAEDDYDFDDAERISAHEDEEESEKPGQPLVSPNAAASVASHFQALAASMVINEADVIERYAQDMLRPMLKQWLDDNLPTLVERLVRAEIERVARGRR